MPGKKSISSKSPNKKGAKSKAGAVKPQHMAKGKGAIKSGLTFAPARTLRQMRGLRLAERISGTSGAFLAAVLETIATDLVTAAGNACKGTGTTHKDGTKGNQRIKPRDLANAIRNDGDYQRLARTVQISDGCLDITRQQYISTELLSKAQKKALEKAGSTQA
jgi:hypothetical protein